MMDSPRGSVGEGLKKRKERPSHCVFPNVDIFHQLLDAREGKFVSGMAIRSSASPIDVSLPEKAFYVCTEEVPARGGAARGRAHTQEICVKYNNCARSRVWWSEQHNNLIGMVARKMGMKARTAGGRHGYEGHWLTLVERPTAEEITDKTILRRFIVERAPSIVQFWQATPSDTEGSPGDTGGSSSVMSSPKMRDELDEEDTDFYAVRLPEKTKKRAKQNAWDTLGQEAVHNMEDATELSFLVDVLDAKDAQVSSVHPHHFLLGEKAEPYDQEDDRVDSQVVAYEIFRNVCETFNQEEFTRWYDMFARTLFLPNVARGLRYFLERGDPRLRADFMFTSDCAFLPALPIARIEYRGSYARGFKLTKVYPDAEDLLEIDEPDVLEKADVYEDMVESKLMLICQHLFFKQMVAQNEIDISQYWFHTILSLPKTKTRVVIRGFSKVTHNLGDVEEELRTLDFQNVSAAYQDILNLPRLPI